MNNIKTYMCLSMGCSECTPKDCPAMAKPPTNPKPIKYIRVCCRCGLEVNNTYSAYSCKNCGLRLKSETKSIKLSDYQIDTIPNTKEFKDAMIKHLEGKY